MVVALVCPKLLPTPCKNPAIKVLANKAPCFVTTAPFKPVFPSSPATEPAKLTSICLPSSVIQARVLVLI